MSEVISFIPRFIEEKCRSQPLRSLFRDNNIVLVGDELGVFYLDKWATATENTTKESNYANNDPLYLWNRRNQHQTLVSYMELVYAASEEGVRDIVIDMASAMQPGIDEGLRLYAKMSVVQTPETLFSSILNSAIASPMDAVVQMAGALGMKVHALNSGLSGVATLFREAKGVDEVPAGLSISEKIEYYRANGFSKDKETLRHLLRREPSQAECDTMQQQMENRLSDNRRTIDKFVFDETPTYRAIQETVGEKPFLAFFQNGRIFNSDADLDGLLRLAYGDENVARLSLSPENVDNCTKHTQYCFRYSVKECTIALTEIHAHAQRDVRMKGRTRG